MADYKFLFYFYLFLSFELYIKYLTLFFFGYCSVYSDELQRTMALRVSPAVNMEYNELHSTKTRYGWTFLCITIF